LFENIKAIYCKPIHLREERPPPLPNSVRAALLALAPGRDMSMTTCVPSTNTGVRTSTFSSRPQLVLPACWLPDHIHMQAILSTEEVNSQHFYIQSKYISIFQHYTKKMKQTGDICDLVFTEEVKSKSKKIQLSPLVRNPLIRNFLL